MVNKIRNGIVWIRTPKCATTTIAEHLEGFCEWKNMKYISQYEHNAIPPQKYINLGHLWAGDVNWDVLISDDRGIMGSIRNPLSRFLSHYKHLLKDGRYGDYGSDVSSFYLNNYDKEHLEDSFRGLDNYMCKYLKVGDDLAWDSSLVKSRYDFFTVTEFMDSSLNKFEKLTGYTFPNKTLIKNKSESNLIITNEFLELFKSRNKNDYELYDFVISEYKF